MEVLDHEFRNIEVYEIQTLDVYIISELTTVSYILEVSLSFTKTHSSCLNGLIQYLQVELLYVYDDERRGEVQTTLSDTKAGL